MENEYLNDLREELSRETIEEGKNEPYVEPEEINAPEEKPIEELL